MTLYYSAATGGFYDSAIHGSAIPADAVKITAAQHAALLAGQEGGKRIAADAKGKPTLITPQADSPGQQLARLTTAVQGHLDAAAQAAGYDSIYTAVSYADEPAVPKYQAEGQAFRAWRSLVWDAANAIRTAVEAGTRPIPTAEQLIAELPALTLPA